MNINKITYEIVKDIIFEVGEGTSKNYPAIKTHDDLEIEDSEYLFGTVVYSFQTSSDLHYDLTISYGTKPGTPIKNMATIDFTVEEGYGATNKQEVYGVMSTISNILQKELARPEVKGKLDIIEYIPVSFKGRNTTEKENLPGYTQRDKLYLAYIGKAATIKKVEYEGTLGHNKKTIVHLQNDRQDNKTENRELKEEEGKAAPYGSGYKRLKEELIPYIEELNKYMCDEGLNIKPQPTFEFIEDEINAEQVLGKTAHYDPSQQHIALYITKRHPKDILRSYAHEVIHHIQNLEGRLEGRKDTVNINEDETLKELEREAYERGNLIFRSWENNKK